MFIKKYLNFVLSFSMHWVDLKRLLFLWTTMFPVRLFMRITFWPLTHKCGSVRIFSFFSSKILNICLSSYLVMTILSRPRDTQVTVSTPTPEANRWNPTTLPATRPTPARPTAQLSPTKQRLASSSLPDPTPLLLNLRWKQLLILKENKDCISDGRRVAVPSVQFIVTQTMLRTRKGILFAVEKFIYFDCFWLRHLVSDIISKIKNLPCIWDSYKHTITLVKKCLSVTIFNSWEFLLYIYIMSLSLKPDRNLWSYYSWTYWSCYRWSYWDFWVRPGISHSVTQSFSHSVSHSANHSLTHSPMSVTFFIMA